MNSSLLFLGDIGGSELILIMVVILIFFGANKIPELARGLGKGIREFKDASSEIRNEFERAGQTPANQPNPNYNPGYAQQPAPYQPNPADQHTYPPAPTAYPSGPVADYSAPGSVVLPSAAPVAHHHDTPIAPAPGHDGSAGNRSRLDQPSTDV